MNKTLIIARKEFEGFVSDRWLLAILAIYLVLVLSFVFFPANQTSSGALSESYFFSMMIGWSNAIMNYGTIFGIMIGFSSMSYEKFNHALNTLTLKPLYRDTIINGKIIACATFLLVVFGLTVALYTASVLAIYGASAAGIISSAIGRAPIIFFITFLYALIFMLLAMLVSILVKRQSVALLLSVLLYILMSAILPTMSFAGNIYNIFGSHAYFTIVNFFPDYAFQMLSLQGLYDPAKDALGVLSVNWANFILFPLYVVILVVLCYVTFLRRDIS